MGDNSDKFSILARGRSSFHLSALESTFIKYTHKEFHESAIDQQVLDNAQCALHYNSDKFFILARDRSSFHISVLEANFIKSLHPLLCKQKEFVYSLKIS